MGLSDQERISKATWAANKITNLANSLEVDSKDRYEMYDNFDTEKDVKRLKSLCLELIPTMSAGSGNSLFWLVGDDAEVGSSNTSLWSLALQDKIKYAMTPEARKELDANDDKKEDMWGKEIEKHEYDLFEIRGYLSEQHKKIYNIYIWCQQFMYASNRYHDSLSERYYPSNSRITLIMNECFNIFNKEKIYAVAYLKMKVFPLLLGIKKYEKYESWDFLTKYIVRNHYLRCLQTFGQGRYDQFDIDTLKKWWIELDKDNSPRKRFWILIELIASRISGKKEETELKDLCKELKIKYEGKVQRSILKARKEKKEFQNFGVDDYKAIRNHDKEYLQRRETSFIHFILNDDED